jgi:hypothetical protein
MGMVAVSKTAITVKGRTKVSCTMPERPADAPYIEAWVDTDGDGDQVHIRVGDEERTYDQQDSNIGMLWQGERWRTAFADAGLTLFQLWRQAAAQSDEQQVPAEAVTDGESVDELEV